MTTIRDAASQPYEFNLTPRYSLTDGRTLVDGAHAAQFACEMATDTPYKPQHRAHRHTYIAGYDNMSMSRATCPSDRTSTTCMAAMCPKHAPVSYSEHMARHATDSFGLPFITSVDWTDDPEF